MANATKGLGTAGGFFAKLLGDLIRPVKRWARDAAEGVTDKASREAQEKLGRELAEAANERVNREIDDALARTNPKFDPHRPAYSENCTSAVQAYELRRRGYDVEAGPLESHLWSSNNGPGGRPIDTVSHTWGGSWSQAGHDDITQAFEQAGPGSRGTVFIEWNGGGGHVFSVENVGGDVRYIDPQNGATDVSHYFDHGGNTRFLRLDDLPTPNSSSLDRFLEP